MGRHSQIRGGRDDRLSKLDDGVLGNILSFLPTKEAMRATALSTRWRDVFTSVHTVSLEQSEGTVSLANGVNDVLLARYRHGCATVPIRSLRVAFRYYSDGMNDLDSMIDRWISYAIQQSGPELHLDLRLRADEICGRGYSLRSAAEENQPGVQDDERASSRRSACSSDDENREVESLLHALEGIALDAISDDEVETTPPPKRPWLRQQKDKLYTVPRSVFSCAALRTLCLGCCKLDPPAGGTNLPSLKALVLTHVADSARKIQRLISSCPFLADLTLEACARVRELSVLDKRLRRLTLRCCHRLASVIIDASELRALEYRGDVPAQPSFLTMHHGPRSLLSCRVDLCGGELTSEEDLTHLDEFLHHFGPTEHLHLTSARLGSGIDNDAFATRFPTFLKLRHLELTGSLPHDDDTHGNAVVAAVARILGHAPNLEVLTLFFKTPPREKPERYGIYKEEEFLDTHHLKYDCDTIVLQTPPADLLPPCLREINLVNYQGGSAQRKLAKFLLGNVARLEALYCGFAEGPLWIQNKLMDEMRGWAMDKIEPNDMMFM
ncbi:unnamed protein product [Triticum turgidum subsp. durum]|uniref:F-box domain-containing protein n=1 Tax=Triticum turgidum subsp. durum TaxID=4567 RepID=A0A9R1QTQ4_TRITD|nr:unnamed protein product [Triticum turgidum subsp. durum]